MASQTRKRVLTVYLTDDEYELLVKKSEYAGYKNRSDFIRHLILYGMVYSVDFSEMHHHNWLLSNLANSLNQIAHQANSNGYATSSDLAEAKRIMEEVWQLQKSILSKLLFKNL